MYFKMDSCKASGEGAFCERCGSEAKVIKGRNGSGQSDGHVIIAGNKAICRWCGSELPESAAFCKNCGPGKIAHESAATPFLDTWRTEFLYMIAGVICYCMVLSYPGWTGLCVVEPEVFDFTSTFNTAIFCVAGPICGALYALFVYPRLFTPSPIFKSPKVVSFLHGFVSMMLLIAYVGLIFGCLWNSELTKRKLGRSRVIAAVCGIAFAFLFGIPTVVLGPG